MSSEKSAIYDDDAFFNNYINLRNAESNYNDLIEQPIVFELIGNVKDKAVMDIGCGYGAMTIKIANSGAKYVLGIDSSKKMIQKGMLENSHENITYKVLPAEQIASSIHEKFDLIVSCLAIHYVEDFQKLFSDIYNLLEQNGNFIFSMEHPMYTASKFPQQWVTEPSDNTVTGFVTDHYGDEGLRNISWLGKQVKKYHHKIDTIFNALIEAGFILEKVIEPSPSADLMKKVPKTIHELHRPAYLIVKSRKG
ncbi:hypothetical protein B5E77_10175 [Lachnoclostridium sp. An131]|uniref:class I SAM-dependent methyltransferase n=1 Tax=Lachnoclostridium sp. An131 TaxID=1965555 RepID=UPI000B376FB2|nr:class I SAM-dependent methyltransferase [Lachnoclostridium sp. An131]OUQ25836.1 hypothetical protein B5E77_10175 [Lachnoclostridium sp. An131]